MPSHPSNTGWTKTAGLISNLQTYTHSRTYLHSDIISRVEWFVGENQVIVRLSVPVDSKGIECICNSFSFCVSISGGRHVRENKCMELSGERLTVGISEEEEAEEEQAWTGRVHHGICRHMHAVSTVSSLPH